MQPTSRYCHSRNVGDTSLHSLWAGWLRARNFSRAPQIGCHSSNCVLAGARTVPTASLGSYLYSNVIASTGTYPFSSDLNYSTGYRPSSTGNNNLKWETSEQTDFRFRFPIPQQPTLFLGRLLFQEDQRSHRNWYHTIDHCRQYSILSMQARVTNKVWIWIGLARPRGWLHLRRKSQSCHHR